jgi:hypothetical protein
MSLLFAAVALCRQVIGKIDWRMAVGRFFRPMQWCYLFMKIGPVEQATVSRFAEYMIFTSPADA